MWKILFGRNFRSNLSIIIFPKIMVKADLVKQGFRYK